MPLALLALARAALALTEQYPALSLLKQELHRQHQGPAGGCASAGEWAKQYSAECGESEGAAVVPGPGRGRGGRQPGGTAEPGRPCGALRPGAGGVAGAGLPSLAPAAGARRGKRGRGAAGGGGRGVPAAVGRGARLSALPLFS